MRLHLILLGLLTLPTAFAGNQTPAANVHRRYIVEAVDLPSPIVEQLSQDAMADVQKLVNQPFSQTAVDDLIARLQPALSGYRLQARTVNGSHPEALRIVVDAIVADDASLTDVAINVNSRYTVESVDVPQKMEAKLTGQLKSDLRSLVGGKFNQEEVARLTKRIRRELGSYRVVQRVTRGSKPDVVRIVFEVTRYRKERDLVLPRLAYHSKENFTFGLDATIDSEGNELHVGILSDNNELIERYSGIRGGYHRVAAGGHFRAGFMAESWRSQWNSSALTALASREDGVPGIYRKRQSVTPSVEVSGSGLTLTAGVSLNRFQTQFPAARYETSYALITSLRLDERFEVAGLGSHNVDAGYSLRAATNSMGGDFFYTRHAFDAAYRFEHGNESVLASFRGGYINGRAPLFERFVLGTAETLRGHSKYDIAPLGGSRMAHGSLDYRRGWFRIVYDTGTIFDRGGSTKVHHSLGAGVTSGHRRDSVSFLVAFPLREGRADPIFILGMNF